MYRICASFVTRDCETHKFTNGFLFSISLPAIKLIWFHNYFNISESQICGVEAKATPLPLSLPFFWGENHDLLTTCCYSSIIRTIQFLSFFVRDNKFLFRPEQSQFIFWLTQISVCWPNEYHLSCDCLIWQC